MNFRRNVLYQWAGVSLFILTAITFAVRGDWMWRVDQTLYDASMRLWERAPSAEIVIVGVDEGSLEKLGRWPWPRALHAQLVERLTKAGARAIGFDMIFSEPGITADDERLARAIAASGRVVLPAYLSGAAHVVLPIPILAAHARLAHAHIELDPDGLARSVYLREGERGAEFPHLSAALVLTAYGNDTPMPGVHRPPDAANAGNWIRDYWLHIPFAGPPGHFSTVSYVDVLQGRVADDVFRDRIVLVGAVAPGMLDAYPTPVSGSARSMPGVELSAHAIDAIRMGADIRVVDTPTRIVLTVLAVLAPLAGLLWLAPRRAFVLAVGTSIGTLLLAVLAMRHPGLWFPPCVPALGALLAYPLWSWRRLEAAQQFLEGELEAMGQAAQAVDLSTRSGWQKIADPMERRIGAVRAASAQLRAARRFVADVVENLPQAAMVVDAQGLLSLGNLKMAELCGAGTPAQLQGRAMAKILMPLRTTQGSSLADALISGSVSLEAVSTDRRTYLVNAAPLHNGDDSEVGRIVSLTDITDLKNAQRKREEYMAFLSHDMRSPQVSILALIEFAELAPERAPKNINERIDALARKTLELADDFVHLARAEEKDPAAFLPADLSAVLREAVEEQEALAARKSISIGVETPDDPVMISGDRQLLVRAIANLLSNAVKYSESGHDIRCRLDVQENRCELSIADTGHGIAAHDLPNLFDRFSRFQTSGASRTAGAGLGLAFVKAVFDKHAAEVDVRSELGRGTTFRIAFLRAGVS